MGFIISDVKEKGNSVEISGFPVKLFEYDLKKAYKSSRISNIFANTFTVFGRGTMIVHRFFLPELYYILTRLPPRSKYKIICDLILRNTWMQTTTRSFPSRLTLSKLNEMTFTPKSYQTDFIKMYDEKKQQYQLRGYLLAFEQGLGKTFTSLGLMNCLKKDAVIIIVPKSTLRTVWQNEIETVFKNKQEMWVIGDKPKPARFYIINYESMEKISQVMPYILKSRNVGIIVDECHNFRTSTTKRVIKLRAISTVTNCQDTLLMSGTPIKALGSEMIPTLQILDSFFDKEVRDIFVKVFGISRVVALDVLKNRLGLIMHRKMKDEVLNLPKKEYESIKIKIPNGNKYTLDTVKKEVLAFMIERKKYYESKFKKYEADFNECIDYLTPIFKDDERFKNYLRIIKRLKKYGYDVGDRFFVAEVARANKFEREFLRPALPPELRKKFDKSKAVIKYVDKKIMGEVIGGLLNRLRRDMFSEMIENSPLCKIINNSIKKTVCFTTFVDVVKSGVKFTTEKCGADPVAVFGETSKNVKGILNNFKTKPNINPLIATIQTLSTGVTIVEANTVVFISKPWRHADQLQAEDRVHRIGQDTDVNVFTFILDTGSDQNLSTRMEDIVTWSKEMFEGIVGDTGTYKLN